MNDAMTPERENTILSESISSAITLDICNPSKTISVQVITTRDMDRSHALRCLGLELRIGLNRYSVRLLGSPDYLILGNPRYSVVTSLPIPSITKNFEQQFIHLSRHL